MCVSCIWTEPIADLASVEVTVRVSEWNIYTASSPNPHPLGYMRKPSPHLYLNQLPFIVLNQTVQTLHPSSFSTEMTLPYLGGGESEFKIVSFVEGRSNVSALWQTYCEKKFVILSLVAPEGKLATKTYDEVGCGARKLEIVCGGVVYFVTLYLVAVQMLWIKIITGDRWLMAMSRWIDLLNMLELWSGLELLYRISASCN